jgi:hypothetical protein
VFWGCGYFTPWVTEFRSLSIPGNRFRSIALLVGRPDRASVVLADQVEQRLAASGSTVVSRAGRWASEPDALQEICPREQPATLDGVLFVWSDQLRLWDCRTHVAAYEVRTEQARSEELLKRLVRYLRGEPPPS